ncbi:MAG TPA: RDD family protein [Burkholderiales bacterium]|nr:RDD family protein [Burkholderiales bacterium]
MADTREPRYAGFWLRLGASIIDVIVLVAIIAPIELFFFGREYPMLAMEGKTLAVDFWTQLALPLLAMILLWRYRSATPGLMLLSARIVDAATLAPATVGKLTLRAVALLVMWLIPILLIGVVWVAFDGRKQGWHDKLAKTVVVRVSEEL